MRDLDYGAAVDFLVRLYEGTEHAVEIRALPQEHGAGRSAPLFGRDPDLAIAHCIRWDGPDRAVYFGCCTRITGAPGGTRADLAELIALWADIDVYKLGLDKEAVIAALRSLPLPPSVIVDSGGGLHCYWLLKEAIDIRQGVDGWETTEHDVVAVLKQLAGICAGDIGVCDLARVLRLPGTHNTKDGGLRLVSVLPAASSWARYEFSDIVDMLDTQRPVVERPVERQSVDHVDQAQFNPFLEFAARFSIGSRVDVGQRLATMTYGAADERSIHLTRLSVTSSLAALGVDDEAIFDLLLKETRRASGPLAEHWNWKREERTIREEMRSAERKYSPATKREVPRESTTAAPASGGSVVNLAEKRQARAETKAGVGDKDPLIPRIGDAVIAYWRAHRGLIAVVDGEPHTYAAGVWTAWGKADMHALKSAIQGIIATNKGIDPKTQILNAVQRYVVEHPDLMREGVEWDKSGLVVCRDGVIDPLTRDVAAHSPQHWARSRAEIQIADLEQGCARWLAFLDSCFSDLSAPERVLIIETIGEWFGAALVKNKPRELRKALWLYGESRTGKTRLSEVLRLLVGEPVSSLKLRALERNFGAAALIGMRGWIADDAIGSSDEVDDAVFKPIVTGEAFSTDVKNSEAATLRLEIPVLLTSNPLPRVKDQSDAVFNRSLLIHMRVVRSEEETAGVIPIDEIVRECELAGVFSWALDGWARLLKRGRFVPPKSMIEAATEFKAANNLVDSWIKESITVDQQWMVDRRDTYASFKGWFMSEFGDKAKVPSPKFVMNSMRQVLTLGPDMKIHGYPFVTGVKLTDDGLVYRKDSAPELGTSPGSGRPENDVNRPRPKPAETRPAGKEARF